MKREEWLLGLTLAGALGLSASSLHAASIIDEWSSVKAPPPPPVKEVTVDPKTTALVMAGARSEAVRPARKPVVTGNCFICECLTARRRQSALVEAV